MGEFKRSPSKVWWGNDSEHNWRTSSSSPGSQDSGFSDSEMNHNIENRLEDTAKGTLAQRIPKDIFKELSNANHELNLSSNYKEKTTPNKKSPLMSDKISERHVCLSEPTKKNRYIKYSPRVNRSLFTRKTYSNELVTNQYAENDSECTNTKHSYASVSTNEDSISSSAYDNSSLSEESYIEGTKSLPNTQLKNQHDISGFLNKTAPPILQDFVSDDEGVTAFNESFSDSECERELEDLFNDLDSPKHTSTPKTDGGMERLKRGNLHMNLLLKFQKDRVPPIHIEDETDDKAVTLWLKENRSRYDPECMISLQSKSIAAELNEKVAYLANTVTSKLRDMLVHSNHIEAQWRKINDASDISSSDTENLIGNIMAFLKNTKRPS
ncbi:hypothetical protein HHI36_011909 [Cryptolaemus montrouzieri]|uniref:Uncharacterized protein n=1 Tax=Cryptolaemus montrouzieri TaxID=559131 RepID=A0ABD2NDE6_9CUCU